MSLSFGVTTTFVWAMIDRPVEARVSSHIGPGSRGELSLFICVVASRWVFLPAETIFHHAVEPNPLAHRAPQSGCR